MFNAHKFWSADLLKKLSLAIVFLPFLFITPGLNAKTNDNPANKVNLYVTVIDSVTRQPLELVYLILQKDSNTVSINITDHSGNSIFHNLAPGQYNISVHYLGYNDYTIPSYS